MKAMSLEELTKEQLEELVRIYARNLLALDGVWFQSVERGRGMDEAMAHDCAVWRRFTETEARRIKTFLGLPERPGLDGLEQALAFRFAALANRRTERVVRWSSAWWTAGCSRLAPAGGCRCIRANRSAKTSTPISPA